MPMALKATLAECYLCLLQTTMQCLTYAYVLTSTNILYEGVVSFLELKIKIAIMTFSDTIATY